MFGRKKDEVVVRGVDEKFIMRFKDYNERKIGVSKTLEMLTKQLGELEKECVEIWEDVKEEYLLSDGERYQINHDTAEIIKLAK